MNAAEIQSIYVAARTDAIKRHSTYAGVHMDAHASALLEVFNAGVAEGNRLAVESMETVTRGIPTEKVAAPGLTMREIESAIRTARLAGEPPTIGIHKVPGLIPGMWAANDNE